MNEFSYHELLHGASIAMFTLQHVLGYAAVEAVIARHPELQTAAEAAIGAVHDLYQAAGIAAVPPTH